ncbi:hypothetical protein SH467x_003533 [Pirellulaceae bacterium SH467]
MKIDPMSYFKLGRTNRFIQWGDYGSVLVNGILESHDGDKRIILRRTGPFVPPITFPLASNCVILTQDAKIRIEESDLSGIGEFQSVEIAKVVSIGWDEWDRHVHLEDKQLPYNGEPEEYILHGIHDPDVAQRLQPLWTWYPESIGRVVRGSAGPRLEGIMNKRDVFRMKDDWWTKVMVSERGMRVLSTLFEDWLTFEEVRAVVSS